MAKLKVRPKGKVVFESCFGCFKNKMRRRVGNNALSRAAWTTGGRYGILSPFQREGEKMETRYAVGREEYRRMTTEELRAAFLDTKLHERGAINLMYCEVERGIAGFAVPTSAPLALPAGKELASDCFCERRELGVLNIGGEGTVTVDGVAYALRPLDVLYVGKGAKEVLFASADAEKPAEFYLASYPAHNPLAFKNAPNELLECEGGKTFLDPLVKN